MLAKLHANLLPDQNINLFPKVSILTVEVHWEEEHYSSKRSKMSSDRLTDGWKIPVLYNFCWYKTYKLVQEWQNKIKKSTKMENKG